ncbi:uncharacterized protein LOC131009992 [Salvia miltiorrhiza]|uniref:uncharacterized protein LOC131009992 n=1 Tax=Salvia miltiorrhiza TaxID=226208 RepID=UPI0025AB82A4|nr:uncharacterized protein LOC131009992 [Salvia miltiorrhiza]
MVTLPLKVMVDKDNTKVLFAEANSDFVNVLLSFLALPLGIFARKFYVKSLYTLYRGLYNMDESYFSVRGAKEMLQNPRSCFRAECRKLVLDITGSLPNDFYVCSDKECPKTEAYKNVSMYSDIATCACGRSLSRKISVGESVDGAFVTNPSSFIVTGDLRVVPILSGLFQTLSNLGIAVTQGASMRSMSFYIDEIEKLFELCLTSATPLDDMIFKKTGLSSTVSTAAKPEPGINLLRHIPKDKAHSREIVLKVFLQESTNKFLYAEAMDDFVDLLFSFLTIPMGGVEVLLGGNTGFTGIHNLYRSVCDDFHDKCFRTPEIRNRLIDAKLPHGYISKNQFLPLSEDSIPNLYYSSVNWRMDLVIKNTSFDEKVGSMINQFKYSRELFVKKHTKCIVTDDLKVDPCLSTAFFILNKLGIPLSDVKEMELNIGLEEALCILKASLTSTTVLTDVLVKPMLTKRQKLDKQTKQEP